MADLDRLSEEATGRRVRHAGEQYPGAYAGTATVVALLDNGDVVVERDQPLLPGMSRRTVWPGWATVAVRSGRILPTDTEGEHG